MKLIPITYRAKIYPFNIKSEIDEISGHFDKEIISPEREYSLHTEYSHMPRKLNSAKLKKYPMLKSSQKRGVPRLWTNITWAEEFADFIIELVGTNIDPKIIEIHPPFNDYCLNIDEFFKVYEVFEKIILKAFPKTEIFIENRCDTFYTGGTFLISNAQSILEFLDKLSKRNLKLKMVLDYPQLFSAEKIKMTNIKLDKIIDFNNKLKPYLNLIGGIHLWGKKENSKDLKWNPHIGNLNTFFSYDIALKDTFLKSVITTFADDIKRYFVPEVNSSDEDLASLIGDLIKNGAIFPIEEVKEEAYDYQMIQAMVWQNKEAYFNIYDSKTAKERLVPLIGLKNIQKGLNKRCVGYSVYDKHIYCPTHTTLRSKSSKCLACEIMATSSYINDKQKSSYFNESHDVYLAYFAKDKIIVGTVHEKLFASFLESQGIPFAYKIAKAPNRKTAKLLEHEIIKLGYEQTISNSYKANHILLDNSKEDIIQILKTCLNKLKNKIPEEYLSFFIELEEYDDIPKVLQVKSALAKGSYEQPSLFGSSNVHFAIEEITPFIQDKEIVGVLGNLAFIKDGKHNYYFDINDLIGYEIKNIK